MALLWSDRGEAQARASLRQVLMGLRKDLGEEALAALRITDETVSFDPEWVTVENGNAGDELLAGFHLHDPAFEEWLRDERLRTENETAPSRQSAPLTLPDKPSIAVLPFVNMSGDPEQEYFSDGITEDIITELTRFRSLFVIGSKSSFHYKGQSPRIQDVGRELGVAYVVEGSVRKVGNRVRITAQLVEAATGHHIWAERYDRELEDIFAVQDEVTGSIVSTLAGHLEEIGRHRVMDKRTEDLAAYDYLLLGDQCLNQGSMDGILRARQMFQRAIDLEPGSARAHTGLARSYLDELWSDWTTAPEAAAEQAFVLAKKAVALDELDGRARVNLAAAYHFAKSNFELAEIQFDKALELNPNDCGGYCLKGWCHALSGQAEQAIVCTDQAIRLSPFDIYDCRMAQFVAFYAARRYEEAVMALGSIPDPGHEVNALLAACYAQLGRDAEARQAMADFMTKAREEIRNFPGEDQECWRRYWVRQFPFKETNDLDHLLDGFRKAGLPV
jgi:TolB-like protein/Flp pilus assembly protein TadD